MPPSQGSLLAPLSHPLVLPSKYLTLIWAAIHVIYERIECTKSQYLREKITRARVILDVAVFRLEIFSAVSEEREESVSCYSGLQAQSYNSNLFSFF